MKLTEILALIFIVAASGAAGHYFWPSKDGKKDLKTQKADTVFVYNTRTDTLPGKAYPVPVKEKVNIDSLWQEAKEYALDLIYRDKKKRNNPDTLNNYSFAMVSDTTFQDSSLTERIKFISPIPLHPKSYFTREITWKERLINQPVAEEESFWSRFSWGLQAGLGYGVIHNQLDLYIGAGASFKIK
ncbi:MAG TPA: hypothetical protein VHO03_03645 [Ignavibacteriales bacterium]|nr:hypothetical protein [Ignavibacteriales bacterium]